MALYAVAALMMTMITADTLLDTDGVWDEMEARGLVPPARRATRPRSGATFAAG